MKIKTALVLKGMFSKTMYVYLSTKLQVSSLVLTSFRQVGVILSPSPSPQNGPLKHPPKLGLI